MSTFLELAQAVKRESGLTGGGPAGIAAATGDDRHMFDWVAWAWRDIELMHQAWSWRRATATATTNAANVVVSPTAVVGGFGLTDFATWVRPVGRYRPSAYRVSDGIGNEQPLLFAEYDTFRMQYMTGLQTPGAIRVWSVAPNGDFLVGPQPDSPHVVRADYIKDHVPLTTDAQVPLMPARFHQLLVWHALREYGGYDAASEVYMRAERNYNSLYSALAQSQLPAMRWGGKPLS